MFGIVLLSVAAVMTAFVIWRMGGAGIVSLAWPWRLLLGVVAWGLIYLGREYGHGRSGRLPVLLELVGMDLLVVVFFAFMLLLAVDLLTCFGMFFTRWVPLLRSAALVLCLALSLLAVVQGLRPPVVSDYEVRLQNLPPELDGLSMVALSDLHIGSLLGADWLQARVQQTMALKPDLVLLLGDIFEGHGLDRQGLLEVMRGLRAPLGVFAVQGNHEHYGREDGTLQLMRDAGYTLLLNDWAQPAPGLVLAGVRDLTIASRSGGGQDWLQATLQDRPQGATVLLSHTPLLLEQAAAQGVGLWLSGHTHAGQVWPFGLLVRLRYDQVAGRYELGPMTAIVSRGAGTWGPRMRLWKPGEILHIVLRAGRQ